MGSADFQSISRVSFGQDLLEESKLLRVGFLDNVIGQGVEGCNIHVSVRVEVVDEFDLFNVLEDEVTHSLRLRLREGEWTGESF